MADMIGSESNYANARSGKTVSRTQGAAPSSFGSAVVAPPISGPLQNIVPGSQEWINARMAAIIEQLKKQYGDAAARRGMLQSGSAEEELADAIAEQERQVAREAGEFNAQIASREDSQAHERQVAREQGRAAEKAAMWSGVGQAAPYALFGKWGSGDKTLAGGMWDSLKGSGKPSAPISAPASPAASASPWAPKPYQEFDYSAPGAPAKGPPQFVGATKGMAPGAAPAPAAVPGVWDKLKTSWADGGAKWGLAGTGAGMLANPKNALGAGLAGGAATFGNAMSGKTGFQNFALPALAGSMIQTKGKVLKGDNLWKNLISAGAIGASFL